MSAIRIQYIEGYKGKLTFGIERQPGYSDEAEYRKFLMENQLTDIDGKTCCSTAKPKEQT